MEPGQEDAPATLDNYDLSTFISGKKTLLISDFEGTTPTKHFDNFKKYCTEGGDKNVIFLGDVFDNTAQYGTTCNGEKCDNPDATDKCPTDENYCALQTIKLLVDNPDNCRYVFGNRDINKIKLLPFFSFEDGTKWWREGDSYADIVKNLLAKLEKGDKDPWMIKEADKKYFRPFWNKSKDEYTKRWVNNEKIIRYDIIEELDKKTEKKVKKNVPVWDLDKMPMSDLYTRFEWIFGSDPAVGTMSALVTLKCIPNELMSSVKKSTTEQTSEPTEPTPDPTPVMLDFYQDVNKDISKILPDNVDLRKKIRVALTLTIFMRMLDKELWTGNKKNKPVGEFSALDGYLYHYLMNAPAAYHATSKDNLLLFAHGGITADFIANGKEEIKKIKKYTLIDWETNILEGGGVCTNKICESINDYNDTVKELLRRFFSTTEVLKKLESSVFEKEKKDTEEKHKHFWKKPMLVLLELSAGKKNNPNQVKEPSTDILDTYAGDFTKIYNVFGHASSSAGYSISKVAESKKTFYINTDFSTTLYKQGIACDVDTYNDNYLIAVLDTTNEDLKLTLDGKVILPEKYERKYDLGDTKIGIYIENEEKGKGNKNEYYFSDDTDLIKMAYEFNNTANVLEKLDEMVKPKFCDFNGIATKEGVNYNVFSTRFRDVTGTKLIYFEKLEEPLGLEALTQESSTDDVQEGLEEESSTDDVQEGEKLEKGESLAGGRRLRRPRKTHRKHPRKTLKKNKRNARKTKHKKARKTKRRL